MNVIWYLAERLAEVITIVLSIYFLYRTMDTKVSMKKQVIATFVFIIIRIIYYTLTFEFRPYFAVLSGVLYAYSIFKGRLRGFIVWNVVAVVIEGIVDATVASMYLLLPRATVEFMGTPGIDRAIILFVSRCLLFVAYFFVTRKFNKYKKLSDGGFALAMLIPVGSWILLDVLFAYSDGLSKAVAQPMLAAGSFALLLILISAIILYNRIIIDEEKLARSQLQVRMFEITQNHISQINSLYTQLSSVRHDLHNHLSAILGYLNAEDYNSLKDYLSTLVTVSENIFEYTNHPVLNVLISSGASMAEEKNIDFAFNLILPQKLPVNDVDLCILVSNILDNAFEASERSSEPRYVNLTARIVDSYWTIACKNSVHDKSDYRSSTCMRSTKSKPELHGIGTRQIQEIAEKTGGFVAYKHKEYEFSTLVMLKMPQV